MSTLLSATLVAMLLLGATVPAAAAPEALRCTAPDGVTRFKVRLPNTARAIRRGEALVIVAIGSSSTQGVGASDQAHTYPALLAEELQRRWPRLAVTVVNKGVGGERADGRRQLVQRWLESQSQIIGYHVGLLVDVWYPA
jgi:acyl-CoA thioesterase I